MNYVELKQEHPELFSNQDAGIKIILDEQIIGDWQVEYRKKLMEAGDPLDWADIGVVYQDPYLILARDLVQFPNGYLGSYIRSYSPKTLMGGKPVAILPVLAGQVLLLHIFRHATRRWHYELPRGYGEGRLSAEDNARKELAEETGWHSAEMLPLGELHENTGREGLPVYLFLARLSESQRPMEDKPVEEEGIDRIQYTPMPEFESMIRDQIITDGFTIAAYTRARLKGYI